MPKDQMFRELKAAYEKKELPLPDPGSMCFMMSKQQHFGRKYGNADPHTMFWFPQADHMSWGAGLPGLSYLYSSELSGSNHDIRYFSVSVVGWNECAQGDKLMRFGAKRCPGVHLA